MNSSGRYKLLDYRLGQQLLELRRKAGLTQREMASIVGVTEKSIRNWEGGVSSPTEANLKKLIETYLCSRTLPPGQELAKARALWKLADETTSRHCEGFDEEWFATLLQQEQQIAHVEHEERANPAVAPARSSHGILSTDSFTRLSRGDWGEAPDVSSFYRRTYELDELEPRALTNQCQLVVLLGMGGLGRRLSQADSRSRWHLTLNSFSGALYAMLPRRSKP